MAIDPAADEQEKPASLVEKLCGRGGARPADTALADRALAELACRWTLLGDELRRATVPLAAGRWAGALRGVTPASPELSRRSAIKLAEEAGEPDLARVCVELLNDTEVSIAAAAGRALVTIAQSAAAHSEAVQSEVLRAVMGIGVHRCRGAAVAAMVLLTPPVVRGPGGARGPLASWLFGEETEAHSALRGALRADRSPVSRERAWEWLRIGRFAAACGERLRALQGPVEFEPLLRRWHLLASPARRGEWKSLRAAGRAAALPGGDSVPGLSAAARRGLIGLIVAQGDGAEARGAALGAMLDDPDPTIRYAAARAAGPDELIDFCFDGDARVARSAVLAWSAVGERGHDGRLLARLGARTSVPRQRWLSKLTRSPHEAVRGIARDERRSTDWLDPNSAGGRAAAWAMVRADRTGTVARLRELIDAADEEPRIRAIALARHLGLAPECEDAIVRVVNARAGSAARENPDAESGPARLLWQERARATGVMALGELGSVHAVETLRACVADDEPRVRANAVEALGRRMLTGSLADEPRAAMARSVIVELRHDDEHRARANALRALLAAGRGGAGSPGASVGRTAGGLIELKPPGLAERDAIEDLLSMLGDVRVMHRLAGAWLSARLIWGHPAPGAWARRADLTARLGELARRDADGRVRARTRHCLAGIGERAARAVRPGVGQSGRGPDSKSS